jgi:hypothetical protein
MEVLLKNKAANAARAMPESLEAVGARTLSAPVANDRLAGKGLFRADPHGAFALPPRF